MAVAVRILAGGVFAAVAAAARVGYQLFAGTQFSNSINLGAVIVALLVVVIAGLFTIRANVAKVWRENYEAEKAKVSQLEDENAALVAEASKQREDKHAALAEVAALQLTDQAAVLKALAAMQERILKAIARAAESDKK